MALGPIPAPAALAKLGPGLLGRLDEIGLDASAWEEASGLGKFLPPRLREPVRLWHLRRRTGPLPLALRALCFGDPIGRAGADAAFGPALVEALLEAGVLAAAPGGLAAPLPANRFGPLLVLGDDLHKDPGGAMGPGPTTALLAEAGSPEGAVGSALDVGCGAGSLALALASSAERVIGVDLSGRAVALSRANAALNGIANVEFRAGDLFAPVAGERFDRIVSQPPFVARPPGAGATTFLDGGARGDEIPRRLLAGLPDHLAPGGVAVALIHWPLIEGESVEERVAPAARDGCAVLLLRGWAQPADEQAAAYAFLDDPEAGADFAERFARRRDHLAALGVESLLSSLVVVERAEPAFCASVEVRPFSACRPVPARLSLMLAAQRLVASGAAAVRGAHVALPEGTLLRELREGRVLITLPDQALVAPVEVDPNAAALLAALGDHPTVADALGAVLEGAPPEVLGRALDLVLRGLQRGLLEPG